MKYFSKIHLYQSGVNRQILEIDVIESETYTVVKDVYIDLLAKIENFLESHSDVLNEFHSSKYVGIEKFHSGKYIYFFRVDIFYVYDFNNAVWLYRTFTENNYRCSETPNDLYQSLLFKIKYELNKKSKY
jgi:hypothetical protein